jgi:DNA topoisomerase IA
MEASERLGFDNQTAYHAITLMDQQQIYESIWLEAVCCLFISAKANSTDCHMKPSHQFAMLIPPQQR